MALYPDRMLGRQTFSVSAVVLIGCVFLGTAVVAEPSMRDFLSCKMAAVRNSTADGRQAVQDYCDFATVLSQILLAIVIGGIVITERWVNVIRAGTDHLQSVEQRKFSTKRKELSQTALEILRNTENAAAKISGGSYFGPIIAIGDEIWRLYRLTRKILPGFLSWMLLVRITTSFPGGFYGVLSFVLFVLMLFAQVVKLYFGHAVICAV